MNNEHSHTHGAAHEETQALLKYMADHNAHHAGELRELEARLPEKAAAHVRKAAALLDASTQELCKALQETEA